MRARAWETDMREMCETAQRLSTQGACPKKKEAGEAHVSSNSPPRRRSSEALHCLVKLPSRTLATETLQTSPGCSVSRDRHSLPYPTS